MAYSAAKFILFLVVLLVPFQFLGLLSYAIIKKSDRERAIRAVVRVPAATFFVVFLALFFWGYFHPGMMIMVSGAINLFILIVLAAGTVLQLACSAAVRFFLCRLEGPGEVSREAAE